jgi:Flp pilus assembly protein TadB
MTEQERQPVRLRKSTSHARVRKWRLSDGDDLENALHAAERLLAEAEERRRHEQNRTFATVSIIVGVILSLAASLIAVPAYIFGLIPVVIGGAILVLLFRELLRQRQRMAHDFTLRLASQLAAMIGETYLELADREEWSYLRREATKLRLAAFPLYDPYRDDTRARNGEP